MRILRIFGEKVMSQKLCLQIVFKIHRVWYQYKEFLGGDYEYKYNLNFGFIYKILNLLLTQTVFLNNFTYLI